MSYDYPAYKSRQHERAETFRSSPRHRSLSLPNLGKLAHENASLGEQITVIRQLKNDPVRYANLLWELAEIMPANCVLTSLQIEPGTHTVVISGSATDANGTKSLQSIAGLMKNLQTSRYFTNATLSGTNATDARGQTWSFNITSSYDAQIALQNPDEVHLKAH